LLALVEATGPRAGLFAYHADGTGHIVALTDASGAITHRYSYGSFGEVLGREAPFAQPFTYAGLVGVMEEPGHGLYYMRARYYHAASHRFVSEDPSGFNGGLNLYAYVGGNPLRYVDPSGLVAQEARSGGVPTIAIPGSVNPFSAANLISVLGPGSKMKAGGFIAGTIMMASGPSSRALGLAMVRSGIERPAGAVTHHIVAGRAADAARAREVLAKYGIGINDAANGAFLEPAKHARLHTKAYYRHVNEQLIGVQSREEAIEVLARIRSGL
jgi:RHS repeat-associated protein